MGADRKKRNCDERNETMRVIAGSARRIPLKTPEGEGTRPTQDRIKETLFNMIQAFVPGAVFLDLFAGGGGIGIEALSRGAKRAYFVENASAPYRCLQENLHKTHLEEKAILLKQDILSALHGIHEKKVDLIYLDPPYDTDLYERTLPVLSQMPYLTEDSLVIAESTLEKDFSFVTELGYLIQREKCYKHNKHVFLKFIGKEKGQE